MRRLAIVLVTLATALLTPPVAQGAFGLHDFSVTFTTRSGETAQQAGTHPFAMSTAFKANLEKVGNKELPEKAIDGLVTHLPRGFVGDQTAVQPCETVDFFNRPKGNVDNSTGCAEASVVGVVHTEVSEGKEVEGKFGAIQQYSPIYNLRPTPGTVARLGFFVLNVPVTVAITVNSESPHNLIARANGISQVIEFWGADFTLWGVPADPAHDPLRGACLNPVTGESKGECSAGALPTAFLTLPRACEGQLESRYEVTSWPAYDPVSKTFSPPLEDQGQALGAEITGCGGLGFAAVTAARPSTTAAESATGLEFTIDVDDAGLKNANDGARALADIQKVVTTFPAGVTANPSAAEGLGVCTSAQFESATVTDPGCPGAAKLGTVEATSPLLGKDRPIHGSLYLASPEDNPFDSLLALYIVFRDEELGIVIPQAGRVDTDPATGRLTTTFADLPPFPLSHVAVQLRSGPRAPLVTPPGCGSYETTTLLYPSSGLAPLESPSSFTVSTGPGGAPCPSALPFAPGFEAGSQSNAAGEFSPFQMRITRADGEQDITRFSATLPPGVSASLVGLAKCPDAAIEAARGRTGRSELASPSCPAGSRIGSVMAGAGVGSALTYVPGSLYLAGSYHGAPLSVAAVVPAVAGPFDVGTVVTRVALALNPLTGQAEVDGSASDPIPHILEGIPLKVRDLRVYTDRPDFTLNPTSCEVFSTQAAIGGGGQSFLTAGDDTLFAAASRYQAASCASLAFKPKLAISLRGGTRRSANPALRAVVTPPRGQANFARAAVTLPKTAFLEQGHIRTICTRVQFAAGAGHGAECPSGSVYGYAKAWSPLLDGPAQGPVYLRANGGERELPDLVAALRGPASAPVAIEVSAYIDSVGGGIRSTFATIPDLPVSRFLLDMQGGSKGLIVNSENLCLHPGRNRARANLLGQNGRRYKATPVVRAVGCKGKKGKRHSRRGRAGDGQAR